MDLKVNNNVAVIYARYSSESQTEQSIEGQIRVITEYAKRNNIPIADTYIDRAISGLRGDRPEFQRMISDSKNKNFGYVLVYKYDRFSRDRLNSLLYKRELKKNGVKVISVTEYISDDPQGILFESIIDGYSEYYSAELSQKVRRGNRESRMKGLYTGGHVLYGFQIINKKYVILPEEAEVVKNIFKDAASGKTYPAICEELKEKGIKYRKSYFSVQTVHKLIHNKKYLGIVETGGEIFTNIIPPLVDEETFKKASVTSTSRKKRGGHYTGKVDYLLNGKIYCGYCGQSVISEGCLKQGKSYKYYKCSTIKKKKGSCTAKSFSKEYLEDLVVEKIKTAILQSNQMETLVELLCKSYNATVGDDNMLLANEKAVAKNKKEINNVLNAIASGMVNESLQRKLNELEEEGRKLEEENIKLKVKNKNKITPEQALTFLDSLLNLDNKSLSYKKNLINRFVKRIDLYNDYIEIKLHAVNELFNDKNGDNNDGSSNTIPNCPPLQKSLDLD